MMVKFKREAWDIEQGYKELREYFGLGKEENRIYEALIARITLIFRLKHRQYINRMGHEPKTIGVLFKDLECELHTLAIAMQAFIEKRTKIDDIVNRNKDFTSIIIYYAKPRRICLDLGAKVKISI